MTIKRRSAIILVTFILTSGIAHSQNWKAGEKWTYQHAGPRPQSDGTTAVKGDRVIEVIAVQGEGPEKRFLHKNTWGTEDANPATSFIDAKNRIHKIDIQSIGVLTFDPPVPALWALNAGEEKTLKTNTSIGGFAFVIEYKAKRLTDETLTVPAGTFEDCQHLQIVSTIRSDMIPPTQSRLEYWYHPDVKNSVKEIIITNYQSENSYTATSTLKSYTTKS